MSYKVLARKWRPKKFNEVIGQEHITRTLINSINSNKIAHAYLLTGTRGIGKTSIARIFAKAIRCESRSSDGEPCLTCNSCTAIESSHSIDYLEIDGASNNSVENIRELVESVQYLPSNGKYKVYVIDEVHMLSTSAFNALLKTLEEPPEHVVFIFATTDPQKLLGTVLSRCQRFDFKNSTVEILRDHVLKISKIEGFDFEDDNIATEIAKQGKGSVRDTLSLLDQVVALSSGDKVTYNTLNLSLGLVSNEVISSLLSAVLNCDKSGVQDVFSKLLENNVNLKLFSNQLLDQFYNLIVSMDELGHIETNLKVSGLESTSVVELLWIYENLSKDISWSLTSLSPENNFCFALIKMALREKIVTNDETLVSVKKKPSLEPEAEAVVALEELPPVTQEIKEEIKPVDLSWEGFIQFLYGIHKSLALNLERGNLLNKPESGLEITNFTVAFSHDSKIFYDFLNDPNRRSELLTLLGEYLSKSVENIHVNFELLNEEKEEEVNFKSSIEIKEQEQKQMLQDQRDEILNSKYIKEAQSLFNTKITKIVLNDEEKN